MLESCKSILNYFNHLCMIAEWNFGSGTHSTVGTVQISLSQTKKKIDKVQL